MCGAGLCSSSLVEPEERALAGQEVAPVRDLESQKRGAPLERGLLYGWFPQIQNLLSSRATNTKWMNCKLVFSSLSQFFHTACASPTTQSCTPPSSAGVSP